MLVFAWLTQVHSRLSECQQNHGWSDPAGRDSAGCNCILMTVDVSCSCVSNISSLMLLGDEFSSFVKFRKPLRDFNWLIADMWLYCWCSSLMLLGDEFSGFVKFRKPLRDFNWLIADMWLYCWCSLSAACLVLSVRLAAVRLTSGGARPASRCRLFMFVGFRQPLMMRQQS